LDLPESFRFGSSKAKEYHGGNFMEARVNLESTYAISEDVVSREIEGEILIVPLVSGIGDMEDELFNLNETGRAVWERLDGQKSLKEVVEELSGEFDAPEKEIEQD
jgi:hypothetical protein